VVPRLKQMTVVGTFDSGHFEYDSGLALLHQDDAARIFRLEGPTGVRASVVLPAATSGRMGPIIDPASTIGGVRRAGRFRRAIKSFAHVRVCGFISCVVEASVYSHKTSPVSQ
jgi:hypothetical protein